jgi:hypothetical protein
VSPDYLIGYIGKDGAVTSWRGEPIGRYRVVSTWPIRSFLSDTMSQVQITTPDGTVYTGRTLGLGMIVKAKRKANQ